MIEMITGYTNHNAIELINQANTNRAILNWEEVTKEELMAFLGVVILMGTVKLPASQLYWLQDDRLHQQGATALVTFLNIFIATTLKIFLTKMTLNINFIV